MPEADDHTPRRYAFVHAPPRGLRGLLRRWLLRWYRPPQPPPPPDYTGRTVTVTAPRADLPPVGAVGEVVGYEGMPSGFLGLGTVTTYRIRFPDRTEAWTQLPAEGIDLVS